MKTLSRRRGFLLILALFIVLLITGFGLAFLNTGALNYQGAVTAQLSQQAQILAFAGLEDARLKLERDINFPPMTDPEIKTFSYSELVKASDSQVIGNYDITIDLTYSGTPYQVITVSSTGRVPGLVNNVQGEIKRSLKAEFDIRPLDRRAAFSSDQNPNLYRIINLSEDGNF